MCHHAREELQMARIGRPRLSDQPSNRNIRIDDATRNRVVKAAEQDGITSSAVIRRALVEHLD